MTDKKSVLVVEDDRDVRELIVSMIEDFGLAATGAGSIVEASARLTEKRPDLVLLDAGIARGRGRAYSDKLDELSIPVVVISGHPEAEIRAKDRSFLPKPFRPQELQIAMERILGPIGEARSWP